MGDAQEFLHSIQPEILMLNFFNLGKNCFLVKVLNSSKIPCLKCEVCSTKSFGSSPVLLLLVFGWQCSGLMAEAGSVTAQRNYPPKMIWSKWFVSQEVLGGKCILQVLPQLIEDCGPQKIQDFRAWFFFSPYEILWAGFAFKSKFYVSIWSFTSSGDLPQLAEILHFM